MHLIYDNVLAVTNSYLHFLQETSPLGITVCGMDIKTLNSSQSCQLWRKSVLLQSLMLCNQEYKDYLDYY